MRNLVWMFEAHRALDDKARGLATQLELLSDRYIRLQEDNKNLTEAVQKLQEYVTTQISNNTVDIFEKYQQQILQDTPYQDGKIPDTAWLTPGENEPVRADG